MIRNIGRRDFIKGFALVIMAGMVLTNPTSAAISSLNNQENNLISNEPDVLSSKRKNNRTDIELSFNKSGKFKILQLADTHCIANDPNSERALENVNKVLDLEKPDLVIHTGDIIYGNPAEESLRHILEPVSNRKIPFAVTFGNHDEEFDKTREELLEIVKSIPYNLTYSESGIYGVTNYLLTLKSSENNQVKSILYFFDSNAPSTINDIYDNGHIHFDQIAWYREKSKYFTLQNHGEPIPSYSFFHIPLPEHHEALNSEDKRYLIGTNMEKVCASKVNSGLFVSMKEMKDVKAVFVGHDHDNDCAVYWNNLFLIYGRYSGGDTVYNNLKPNGARVIELTEDGKGFRSWIRLSNGEIIQDLQYPDDFQKLQ